MTKTWQLRAFFLYLTLGVPLAASCAKEANTLDGDGTGDTAGSTSSSGKGSISMAGTLNKAGTTGSPFGGTGTAMGGKAASAGATAMDGGEASVAGTGMGGTGGAAGSASGGSGGTGTTVPPEVLASAKAVVHYQTDHATASDKMIRMVLHITNQSDNPLSMTNVKVRYWFTAEAPPTLHQYYTAEDVRPASAMFVDDGANSHVLMTFGGGTIKKGDDISRSQVQLAIDSSTTAFDQADDFSWAPTSVARTPNDKITLYLDDKLIWGCEPSGDCFDGGGVGGAGSGGQGAGGEPQ